MILISTLPSLSYRLSVIRKTRAKENSSTLKNAPFQNVLKKIVPTFSLEGLSGKTMISADLSWQLAIIR